MNFIKLTTLLFIANFVNAELVEISEQELGTFSGQSGVTFEGNVNLTIDEITYQQTPDSSYQILHNIVADYQYGATTIDVTNNGSVRFGLPEFIHFNELSFGLYTSKEMNVDPSNSNDIQTYTIYADTLGNAYDGFDLNISGATFDNGSNSYSDDYVNSPNLEGNRSTQLTITEATDINLTLTSEDDCTGFGCDNQEDFAHIVIVDEDGEIVAEAGQSGQNNTSLDYSFDSPINNNFILHATLTGTFKMGGAIEMFSFSNPSFKR